MVIRDVWAFGDYQDMDWCLRVNVVKRQAMCRFQKGVIGDFATEDFGKNILIIIAIRHEHPR